MALDSNTPLDAQGHPLRHFTPWPTQNSAGVNVFFPNSSSFCKDSWTPNPARSPLLCLTLFPGVTAGLLSQSVLKILSASVFWVTTMCYYFPRQ